MRLCSFPIQHGQIRSLSDAERLPVCNVDILVADSDFGTRQAIIEYLKEQQIRAAAVSGPKELMSRLATDGAFLVILDLQFGENHGLDLLRAIQSRTSVPVIITGPYPCDAIDPLVGLEIGADDYLTKPFGLRELLARIRAVLRRKPAPARYVRQRSNRGCYRFSGWHLDQYSRRLTNPSGNRVALTKGQYALLLAFLRAPRRPLSRQVLSELVKVRDDSGNRAIDVQILRLRRTLMTKPEAPCLIKTERGLGYVFTASVEELPPDIPPSVRPVASPETTSYASNGRLSSPTHREAPEQQADQRSRSFQ